MTNGKKHTRYVIVHIDSGTDREIRRYTDYGVFSDVQVRMIRRAREYGVRVTEIAKTYGVSATTIYSIINGKSYRNVA